MKVEVRFDTEYDLVFMPDFSKWFTENKINPQVGELLFVPDGHREDFKKEVEFSGSTQWIIDKKFYDPSEDKIIIWCIDSRDK